MKAITKYKYGGPEVLQFEEITKPQLKENHLLIRVKANAANPADWRILRADPFFVRLAYGLFTPKHKVLGADFAGIVEAVGEDVTGFEVGDCVFGETLSGGAFAEYACVPAHVCAKMPQGTSFKEMACLPVAGLTALQALTTYGNIQQGESVLINGASGGVGHFAVQIAKAYGAEVTAVCSSRNVDFVQSIGADKVIAYDKENIYTHKGKYDLVIDVNGNLSYTDYKRMGQRGIIVGFTSLGHMMSLMLKKSLGKYPLTEFTAEPNTEDLEVLADLVVKAKMSPHIEQTYSAAQIPEAIAHIETKRTRGKVAMEWE